MLFVGARGHENTDVRLSLLLWLGRRRRRRRVEVALAPGSSQLIKNGLSSYHPLDRSIHVAICPVA